MLRVIVAAVVFMAGPAAAQDFLSPVKVASWSGFYAGVSAGAGWGSVSRESVFIAPVPPFDASDVSSISSTASRGLDASGFSGGIQAGYNVQHGSLLWGIESDFQYLGLKGSNTATVPFPSTPASSYSVTTSVATDWLFTARGRAGLVLDRALVYGTAGFAVGNQKVTQTISIISPFAVTNSISETRIGWVVGAGAEYAVGGNWTAKAEYLYVDLGKSASATGTISPAFAGVYDQASARLAFSIARLGVNRHF